ncbi:MAG: nicotinate phosphoribosyltransferase [Deltaproteobacteria bacterium]|nr:nicotinate phosphoribosyltransferase [Deltaproteobacteria bacterium]
MRIPSELYQTGLALHIDLYELTMAHGYWKLGLADREAVFHLTFRENPFSGGFALACGLEQVLDYLTSLRFDPESLAWLAALQAPDGTRLFDQGFLDHLRKLVLTCDVDAIPEGTVVFAEEPLLRVRGPVLQAQLLETALLNAINFQTLIATKASRVKLAAQGQPVIEFGLRRAQGIDGGLSASRAAYVGGCDATSNVLAGRLFGIPVRGTHAHSWVTLFDDEAAAFDGWAEAMPGSCVLLVDTYDTLRGVEHAIATGRRLRERGHDLAGIRLDSGDLAWLSVEARRMLDEAGFTRTLILASNELDEHVITSLKDQGAAIGAWGVGTRLVTAYDQPALGGVYKLAAVREPDGRWRHTLKLSEQTAKVSTPGILQVRRFEGPQGFVADMIWDELSGAPEPATLVDPLDLTRRKTLPAGTPWADLLVPVLRDGKLVYHPPGLTEVRARAQEQLGRLHPGIRRFLHPHQYPVGLEKRLHELKTELVLKAREANL